MSSDGIPEQINEILTKAFEVDPELLEPDARLADDLQLDSLDGVDLVVALEKKFGCRIDEAEARAMRTLKDMYDCVERSASRPDGGS